MHLARGLDRVWEAPCRKDGACHHGTAFQLVVETMRDCVFGPWNPDTGRRQVIELADPVDRTLAGTADNAIHFSRLDAAIRALAPAAQAGVCVSGRARELLTVLLAAHRRSLLSYDDDMDHRGTHALIAARALLTIAADGDDAPVHEHIDAYADNPALLLNLLRALSAAGEETARPGRDRSTHLAVRRRARHRPAPDRAHAVPRPVPRQLRTRLAHPERSRRGRLPVPRARRGPGRLVAAALLAGHRRAVASPGAGRPDMRRPSDRLPASAAAGGPGAHRPAVDSEARPGQSWQGGEPHLPAIDVASRNPSARIRRRPAARLAARGRCPRRGRRGPARAVLRVATLCGISSLSPNGADRSHDFAAQQPLDRATTLTGISCRRRQRGARCALTLQQGWEPGFMQRPGLPSGGGPATAGYQH